MNPPKTFPLMPQCSHCRRFRSPSGSWVSNIVLAVLAEHPSFPYTLTHGICDECAEEMQLMECAMASDLSASSRVVERINAVNN
jgi:hypothetical protein